MSNHSVESDALAGYYCPTCEHPWGYHHVERGCTMPLDITGLPITRTDQEVGRCECRAVKTNG